MFTPIAMLVLLAGLFTQQKDVLSEPPSLGTPVSKVVVAARRANETCLTAASHFDPCAQINADHVTYIVAWDKVTSKVVYVFTSDLGFVTDSELGVGGTARIDRRKLITYKSWLVAFESSDTANGEGTGDKWYPVVAVLDLPSNNPDISYASIAGFVQSEYLNALLPQPAVKAAP